MNATKLLPEVPDPGETVESPSLRNRRASGNIMSAADLGRLHPYSIDLAGSDFDGTDVGTVGTTHSSAEPIRRYRVKKLPASLDSRAWKSEDETSLSRILEQERNAWSTQSPTTDSTQEDFSHPHCSQIWYPPTSPNPEQYVRQSQHSLKRKRWSPKHYEPSECTETDSTLQQPCLSEQGDNFLAENVIQRDSPERRKFEQSRAQRTSYFLEGSMNEHSKGIASTWSPPSVRSDMSSLTDSEDGQRTPRASAANRDSTSSSIDINEFKPLPATPSTFKSTVKRLGQRLRTHEPAYVKAGEDGHEPRKQRKGGLRKSVSTWKIFANQTPDYESEAESATNNQPRAIKTLRLFRNAKSEYRKSDFDMAQKAILDERKRKAEALYAEHYSKAHKRYKQAETKETADPCQTEACNTATVRRQQSTGFPSNTTMHTALRKVVSQQEIAPEEYRYETTPHMVAELARTPEMPQVDQFSTYGRRQKLESDTNNYKKPSISELEKENRHLRSMLREKDLGTIRETRRHRARRKSASDQDINQKEESPLRPKSSSGVEDADDKLRRFTDLVGGLDTMRRSSANSGQASNAPILCAPPSLQNPPLVSSSASNNKRLVDTATVKRRTPLREHSSQVNLPRPLSMVLEGIETDEDQENDRSTTEMKVHAYAECDGITEQEMQKSTQLDKDPHLKAQQWQWPEDVF